MRRLLLLAAITLSSCDLGTPLPALAQIGYWPGGSSAGAVPGGAPGQVQVNNGGLFGGLALGDLANVSNTINVTGLNGQSLAAYHASPPPIGSTTPNSGAFTSLTVAGITGSTQCVRANSVGLLSGAGADCNTNAYAGQATGPLTMVTNKSSDGSTSTMKMAGLGATFNFTPAKSTRELVTLYCTATNASNGTNDTFQPYYGTGSAPANQAAVTGTAVGSTLAVSPRSASAPAAFSSILVITGLTIGSTYWFDVSMAPSTGSYTLTINPCTFTATDI